MKRLLFYAAAAVSLGSLTACDLAPKYHPDKFVLPASYQGGGPWQVAHPRDEIPRGPWWQAYGNPTLNELEDRIPQNPDLLAQREKRQGHFRHPADDHAGADRADRVRRGHAGFGANPDRPLT